MIYEYTQDYVDKLHNLKIDCKKCFGLCCIALYFSVSEGFPADKEAGKACTNLAKDFCCVIHNNLLDRGLKGCAGYDCFGAGQKVAQVTYRGQDWHKAPESAQQMFEVFYMMKQLHEMLWYLVCASLLKTNDDLKHRLSHLINETEELTYLTSDALLELDIDSHRYQVNNHLREACKLVQVNLLKEKKSSMSCNKTITEKIDLIGKDLRKVNLMGANLAGAFLIEADLRENDLSGANLIGADLRNADIRGANLTQTLFVTQSQINNAKGDSNTRLPVWIDRPKVWQEN